MRRFIIRNRESGIYCGMIPDREYAEKLLVEMREAWPGIEWEIEKTEHQFPVPGLIHIGEVRGRKILKRYQRQKLEQVAA